MTLRARQAKGGDRTVEYLYHRYVGTDPKQLLLLEEVRAEDELARWARRLREESGLSQAQLAKKLGLKSTLINDLEEADYEGNALGLLRRICAVLDRQVEVRVVNQKAKGTRMRATGS